VPFDVRTQLLETSQDVPTNEGLVVHLDGAHYVASQGAIVKF